VVWAFWYVAFCSGLDRLWLIWTSCWLQPRTGPFLFSTCGKSHPKRVGMTVALKSQAVRCGHGVVRFRCGGGVGGGDVQRFWHCWTRVQVQKLKGYRSSMNHLWTFGQQQASRHR
jgi:hypothetical protein